MGRIVGEIPRPRRVCDGGRLVEEVQRQAHRRGGAVAVTVTGLAARRVVTVGRYQRRAVHLTRPGAGQQLPVAVVGISHTVAVGVGLGGHPAAVVVTPGRGLRRVGVLESRQRRLLTQAVPGVASDIISRLPMSS